MTQDEFRQRTRSLAVAVLDLSAKLPHTIQGNVVCRQLVRAGTSIGANYSTACRARSKAEMAAKLQTVHEEGDETLYWIDIAVEARLLKEEDVASARAETDEIVSMTVASLKTLRNV